MPSQMTMAQKGEQLVGGYIPRQISDQLGLLALYHNTSRSEIIRTLLIEHINSERDTHEMVRAIARRILADWHRYRVKKGDRAIPFSQFCTVMWETLQRRKISVVHREMIIQTAKELRNANKRAKVKQSN